MPLAEQQHPCSSRILQKSEAAAPSATTPQADDIIYMLCGCIATGASFILPVRYKNPRMSLCVTMPAGFLPKEEKAEDGESECATDPSAARTTALADGYQTRRLAYRRIRRGAEQTPALLQTALFAPLTWGAPVLIDEIHAVDLVIVHQMEHLRAFHRASDEHPKWHQASIRIRRGHVRCGARMRTSINLLSTVAETRSGTSFAFGSGCGHEYSASEGIHTEK